MASINKRNLKANNSTMSNYAKSYKQSGVKQFDITLIKECLIENWEEKIIADEDYLKPENCRELLNIKLGEISIGKFRELCKRIQRIQGTDEYLRQMRIARRRELSKKRSAERMKRCEEIRKKVELIKESKDELDELKD